MKNLKISFIIILFAAFMLQACDKRENNILFPPGIQKDLVETAEAEGLTTFAAALKVSGIDKELDFLGQNTLLAPNNAAFAAAGITPANIGTVPVDLLRAILRNHMISGRVPSANLLPGPNATYTSIQRDLLNTSTYAGATGGSFFNGKKILKVDILANNGIIHVLNGVLLPPAGNLQTILAANPDLSFLAAAISRAGLTTTLNTTTTLLTIFAPTNAAFIAAGFPDIASINAAVPATLANILTYHVITSTDIISPILASPFNRNGRLFSPDFVSGTSYKTAQGTNVTATVTGGAVSIRGTNNPSGSNVTIADIVYYGGNVSTIRPGVLHIIDRVLLP